MPTHQNYLNSADVARVLCCTTQTVVAYTHNGKLPASKVGRRWLYTYEDVQRLVNDSKRSR